MDFESLAKAAKGPDVWLHITCYDYILSGGSCTHQVRLSLVYLIATRGADWRPSRHPFVCTRCGARANFGFGHPKWPFGQGNGAMPMVEFHRRIQEHRWGDYLKARGVRQHSPAWRWPMCETTHPAPCVKSHRHSAASCAPQEGDGAQ